MKCPRCEGEGYFLLIMKARSTGVSTLIGKTGDKVTCPDCDGTGEIEEIQA